MKLNWHHFFAFIITLQLVASPDNLFEYHINQATSYKKKKKFRKAEFHLKAALKDKPSGISANWGLGIICHLQGRLEEAAYHYNMVLEQIPDHQGALMRLAKIKKDQGNYAESIAMYKRILKYNPANRMAQAGIAQVQLQDGTKKFSEYLQNGGTVTGKIIFIRYEWNLGDTMQFVRYIQTLKKHGATLIFFPPPPLYHLISCCPYIDHVLKLGDSTPKFDHMVSIVYLPGIIEFIENHPNPKIPYLYAQDHLVEYYRATLSKKASIGNKKAHFKIGLCWCGALHDYDRFIELEKLVSIANTEIALYSLQTGPGIEQLNQLPAQFTVHSFGPDFDKTNGAFVDTAAVMKNLDLVITIDTSIAHLAGGLGVPVWVLLPYKPAWRWINDKCEVLDWIKPSYKKELAWMGVVGNSPWHPHYPSMRIFQQQTPGNWDEVLYRVKKSLHKKLQQIRRLTE